MYIIISMTTGMIERGRASAGGPQIELQLNEGIDVPTTLVRRRAKVMPSSSLSPVDGMQVMLLKGYLTSTFRRLVRWCRRISWVRPTFYGADVSGENAEHTCVNCLGNLQIGGVRITGGERTTNWMER
jgi:hypothetical protein